MYDRADAGPTTQRRSQLLCSTWQPYLIPVDPAEDFFVFVFLPPFSKGV